MKYLKEIEEIGDDKFYSIILPVKTKVEVDERSKTDPGHGYPEYIVKSFDIVKFDTKERLLKEVKRLMKSGRQDFKIVTIHPGKVSESYNVHIDITL